MNWTNGYASDVEYTAGYYREQSPTFLNFAALLNGCEPVDLEQPFTYCELGCGRALTALILAATHAKGRFYAFDFNPTHIAEATRLRDAAQLSNLKLIENSFESLAVDAQPDLPQFDFITLHGIYSWVNADNRRFIVEFLSKYLKPGGIVYLSYNAMPGWAAVHPLQRMLLEIGSAHQGRSDAQIAQARQAISRLKQLNAGYLRANPALQTRLDLVEKADPRYLAHEYMHRHWQPLYHADVAQDLADAKLSYVGSANLEHVFQPMYLSEEQRAFLAEFGDPAWRETMKDLLLNTAFRRDVFVRGAVRAPGPRQVELLRQYGLALIVPRDEVKLKVRLSVGEINGPEALYGPLLDQLNEGPAAFPALLTEQVVQAGGWTALLQMAVVLISSGQAEVFRVGEHDPAPSLRLNRAMAARTRYSDEHFFLAAPLLQSGVAAGFLDRLLYGELVEHGGRVDLSAFSRNIWPFLKAQGRKMIRDGQALESDDDNLARLHEELEKSLGKNAAAWQRYKVI